MKSVKYFIFIAVIAYTAVNSYAQENDSLVIPYTIINSTPQNAEVYINGEQKGETPFRIISKDSSELQIVLKLKGYLDYSFKLSGSGFPQKKEVALISKSGAIKNFSSVNENGIDYFHKPRKWGFVALGAVITAASGIAAYYFKSLSIENNDDFYITGNPDDLTKKKKYDLISGISVGVLQLGLATMLYFLFGDN